MSWNLGKVYRVFYQRGLSAANSKRDLLHCNEEKERAIEIMKHQLLRKIILQFGLILLSVTYFELNDYSNSMTVFKAS